MAEARQSTQELAQRFNEEAHARGMETSKLHQLLTSSCEATQRSTQELAKRLEEEVHPWSAKPSSSWRKIWRCRHPNIPRISQRDLMRRCTLGVLLPPSCTRPCLRSAR